MATNAITKPDELSAEERKMAKLAIELKMASLKRASNSEADPEVADLRKTQYDKYAGLLRRFS